MQLSISIIIRSLKKNCSERVHPFAVLTLLSSLLYFGSAAPLNCIIFMGSTDETPWFETET